MWGLKVFVIVLAVEGCHLISSPNGSAEVLWNLVERAIEGRQVDTRQSGGYGLQPHYNPQHAGYRQPQSFMDALASVAYNDELHCVPKLLCELTSSGTATTNRRQQSSSFLPFNFNMESLLGLLSSFDGASPLVQFGRAALLGYTSNGNPSSCTYSYPRCPGDPDRLVDYLNNYNGGFFRYFNGLPRPQAQQPGYYYGQQQQHQGYYQGRILTRPQLAANSLDRLKIKFPADAVAGYGYKSGRTLTFPAETAAAGQYHFGGPKTFAINKALDFQRPPPHHVAAPEIYPTRTGTGELILDSEAFDFKLYHNPNHVAFTRN